MPKVDAPLLGSTRALFEPSVTWAGESDAETGPVVRDGTVLSSVMNLCAYVYARYDVYRTPCRNAATCEELTFTPLALFLSLVCKMLYRTAARWARPCCLSRTQWRLGARW
jgi:hypothetical protein